MAKKLYMIKGITGETIDCCKKEFGEGVQIVETNDGEAFGLISLTAKEKLILMIEIMICNYQNKTDKFVLKRV